MHHQCTTHNAQHNAPMHQCTTRIDTESVVDDIKFRILEHLILAHLSIATAQLPHSQSWFPFSLLSFKCSVWRPKTLEYKLIWNAKMRSEKRFQNSQEPIGPDPIRFDLLDSRARSTKGYENQPWRDEMRRLGQERKKRRSSVFNLK